MDAKAEARGLKRPQDQKPVVKKEYREDDFIAKDLPFVGATSVYKTYVPASDVVEPMTATYCHKPEIVLKGDGEPFVVYDAETGIVLEINETAFRVIEFCKEPRTVEELVRMLESHFDGTPSRHIVESGVQSLLDVLCERGVLTQA